SDWKAVKPEIMKWFSMSNPSFNTRDIETQTNNGFPSTVLQVSRKWQILKFIRLRCNHYSWKPQLLKLITFFNVTIGPANGEVSLLGTTEIVDYPTDTWGDIVVEAGNNQEIRLNNLETTQLIRLSSVHLSLKLKEDNVLDGQMMEIYVVVYICQVIFRQYSKGGSLTPSINANMCGGKTVL
nr:histone-lysine N-methyltransferase SUVR5 [Tanacetum cinerariifolium]